MIEIILVALLGFGLGVLPAVLFFGVILLNERWLDRKERK